MTSRVTVVRPRDLGASDAQLWASFQRRSAEMQSPFLSLGFARAVGDERSSARVAIVEIDGRIEAFLAYERTPTRIGWPIGWPMNDLQGFVGSGAPFDAREVVRSAGLRGWRFDHALAAIAELARHEYTGTTVECPVADLSDGYDRYLASRPRSLRRESGRTRRNLEHDHGPVSFEWRSTSRAEFDNLIRWKSGKYTGTRELFRDPSAHRIVERLAFAEGADCSGVLSVLGAGGRTVAVDLKLQGPSGVSGWLGGYDPAFARYAPGTLVLLAVAEHVAAHGLGRLDLGYGQHLYKFRLGNTSYRVAGGAVWVRPTEALARAAFRRVTGRGRAAPLGHEVVVDGSSVVTGS